jgi:hypothetical protein
MQSLKDIKIYHLSDVAPNHPAHIFYKHWQAIKSNNGVYNRASLNPMKFPRLLPWMTILEKEYSGANPANHKCHETGQDYQMRYRLCGSGYVSLVGKDLTNEYLGQQQTIEEAIRSYDILELCLSNNFARASIVAMPIKSREFIKVVRAAFPICSDGETLNQVMLIVAPIETTVNQ